MGVTSPRPLEVRFWEKVQKTDGCWIWTGAHVHGYGHIHSGGGAAGRMLRSHRVSYEWANGPIPDGLQVDHICMNRACVNPDHLRLATNKQNNEHRAGALRNNKSSGVRGVYRDKRVNLWKTQLKHNGRTYSCGYHKTIAEAEAAVIAKRNELFTHNDADRTVASWA